MAPDAGEGGGGEPAGELTLEQLAELPWFQALDRELEADGKKGWSVKPEDLEAAPFAVQQHIHNLAGMVKRASSRIGREASDLAKEREALAAERRKMEAEWAEAQTWAQRPELKELLERYLAPEGEEPPDPFSEAGINHRIGRGFKDFMDAMTKAVEAQKEAVVAKEAEHQAQLRRVEQESYIEKHQADFESPEVFGAIKQLLDKTNGTLSIEEAHQFVMAQRMQPTEQDELEAARRRARDRIRGTGPRDARPTIPSHLTDATEIGLYASQNPEVLTAMMAQIDREGTGY